MESYKGYKLAEMRKDREFARECWVVIWELVGVVVEIVVVVVKMINYGVVRDIDRSFCNPVRVRLTRG